MNDHVSDDSQPFHHQQQQQQQQHGYPPLHRQQQQHLQLQNQQHIFTPPPPPQLMSNQSQLPPHHHHPHQLHPLVQARMQQQFHHIAPLPPPVRSHNSQTWDGSASGGSAEEQRQQPVSSGHYDRDQMFKGATEHLLSAVQQQIESMRGHESEEVEGTTVRACANPSMQSVDTPLTTSSQPLPDNGDHTNQVAGKDTATGESEDGLLTVQVRITEANRELQAQKEQRQNRTADDESNNTGGNQALNTSTESQQSSAGRVSEHVQSHSEGQCEVPRSSTNTSSPTLPVNPAPRSNTEAAEKQPVAESESQSGSKSVNEKGM